MANLNSTTTSGPNWLGPERPENDFQRYAMTLRRRGWLIVVTVVAALLVAAAYVKTATPVYQAQSSLLVSPVAATATLPTSVSGLIGASSDPTRDIQTAATVVSSPTIASAVGSALHLGTSPTKILGKISVQPVSNSNVLAIVANSNTANEAARLANEFARQTIIVRSAQFRAAVNQQIASLRAQIARGGGGATAPSAAGAVNPLQAKLADLQTLSAGPLPDMSISALAVPPLGRTSPKAALSLAAALIVGLVLGILGVLGLEAFDSTLRREEQLKTLFQLPILARIPRDRQRKWHRFRRIIGPRTPDSLALPTLESFRTLRAMALASRPLDQAGLRSILVTSAAPAEGKTTTALNLAASLADSGASVILIEGDLRRPSLGDALELQAPYDVTSVVTSEVSLDRALVSTRRYPNLQFLLARGIRSHGPVGGDALFLPSAGQMLEDAERLVDYVVVDSPPLLAVIDALDLARAADGVLIVAQLGRTHLGHLTGLGALLAEAHINPLGVALIGAALPGGRLTYEYQYQQFPRAASGDSGGDSNGDGEGELELRPSADSAGPNLKRRKYRSRSRSQSIRD